jgi:hypothetical protein
MDTVGNNNEEKMRNAQVINSIHGTRDNLRSMLLQGIMKDVMIINLKAS